MPSASQEVDDFMEAFHGSYDDATAILYLEGQGYHLGRDWRWSKPGVTLNTMTYEEYMNMLYLIEEWDFGGLVED